MEHFTRFGTEVDKATRLQIEKGKRILMALKQQPNQPLSFPLTIVILFALNRGFMDQIPLSQISDYEKGLRDYFTVNEPRLINEITTHARLTDQITEDLNRAVSALNNRWAKEKGEIS